MLAKKQGRVVRVKAQASSAQGLTASIIGLICGIGLTLLIQAGVPAFDACWARLNTTVIAKGDYLGHD